MSLLTSPVRPLPSSVRSVLGTPLLEGLATPHGVSRYLEHLHPLWTLEGGRAQVTALQRETPDMLTLELKPDHAWKGSLPGQHVRLGVELDGVTRTRTYSVSSSAHRDDGRFTVTVKQKPDGVVSGHLHTALDVGDVVDCSPATGEVVLPDPRPERLLLISGGSGITPLAGMLRTLADEAHTGHVTFLHYARSRVDVPFLAELAAIAAELPDVEVVLVLTGEAPDAEVASDHLRGRFSPEHLETCAPGHLDVPTYACGPAGLVDAVESAYTRADAAEMLQVERFTPPALRRTAGATGGAITFAASDTEVVSDGTTLLEQAETAGLTPEYGCRMGICHTCTRPKPAGAVTDQRTGRTSDVPDEDIQICVSVPAGDVVLDL